MSLAMFSFNSTLLKYGPFIKLLKKTILVSCKYIVHFTENLNYDFITNLYLWFISVS